MERETIFIGFLSVLAFFGLDLLTDSHTFFFIWLALVAIWGVCSHLTLTQQLERYREDLRRMRDNGESRARNAVGYRAPRVAPTDDNGDTSTTK